MAYTISKNGDWLEKQAANFIAEKIPAYELIWQLYIGHKGAGKMAEMKKIKQEDDAKRRKFAQHHYTILESLFFMQKIIDDESQVKEIRSFDDYRKVINQLMSYHSYSGRLRDNMAQCFIIIGASDQANSAEKRLDEFYSERHVFVHGKKVPFSLDSDNLFKTPTVRKGTLSREGYSLDEPWETVTANDMVYVEESLKASMTNLAPVVEGLLQGLFQFVKDTVNKKSLELIEVDDEISPPLSPVPPLSGSNITYQIRNTSN